MLDDIEYDVSVAHSASTFEILVTIANDITQISCFVKCFMNELNEQSRQFLFQFFIISQIK